MPWFSIGSRSLDCSMEACKIMDQEAAKRAATLSDSEPEAIQSCDACRGTYEADVVVPHGCHRMQSVLPCHEQSHGMAGAHHLRQQQDDCVASPQRRVRHGAMPSCAGHG